LLLGNSGDQSNNHIDIIKIIKKRSINNKIYLSIAYGGDDNYKKYIFNLLDQCSLDYYAQEDFIDLCEYKKNIRQCRVAVFGHLRQQAIGNINLCILNGCKVFLYKESIAYLYYKNLGFNIYSIEDDLFQENIDQPMHYQDYIYNLKLYRKYEDVLSLVQNDLKIIRDKIKLS
jgi:hypothetical protein